MKQFVTICIMLLLSTVAYAQSDCNAPNCGSLPLLNFDNENGGVTDLFLHSESDCDVYFRTRFSPVEGYSPEPNFYKVEPGDYYFSVSDIMDSWTDYESRGTFIIDWATYDCVPNISAAGRYGSNDSFPCPGVYYDILEPYRFLPGCYSFIITPGTDSRFNVYNASDTSIQSLKYDGDFFAVMPGETLEWTNVYTDSFLQICIGEEFPGPSIPGFDYTLPLFIEGLTEADSGAVYRIIHLP